MTAASPPSAEIETYLDALWMEKGLSENTLASYRRDLVQYRDWLQKRHQSLLASSGGDLQAYLAWRSRQQRSPRSTARFLSCDFSFCLMSCRSSLSARASMAA